MASTIYENIFYMLGGIAFLMFGMKIMGSNLEQVAGNNMKALIGKVTSNRFAGVGIGAAVTAIINSSTATTVMLVGFVNVGLMTLTQATSVIMGANIGTTLMAVILALTGTGFEMAAYASLIAVLGIIFILVSKNDRLKKVGYILIGLGLIFIGLKVMSSAVDWIKTTPPYKTFIENLLSKDLFPLLLILIGLVLTAVMHSSGALTAVLIALGSVISFKNAAFIILGSNIGTCVTSLVSSIGTSTNAKRTAIIHLLFNCIGCLIFIAPVWIWGSQFGDLLQSANINREMQIAIFHVVFNISTTLILIGFIKPLVKLAEKIIPEDKSEQAQRHKLTYIDARLLETPAIAMANTKKEIIKMSAIARENLSLSAEILLDKNDKDKELLEDNEDALNFLNKSITKYLTKLMGKDMPKDDEKIVGTYYHVVTDLERVGDYSENIMEYADRLEIEGMDFSEDAKQELRDVFDTIDKLCDKCISCFAAVDTSYLDDIDILEESIDKASVDLEAKHIERLKKGECSPQVGSVFLQAISNLERVGDHLTNIAFSITQYNQYNKMLTK